MTPVRAYQMLNRVGLVYVDTINGADTNTASGTEGP